MIPADAAPTAFLVCLFVLAILPSAALLISVFLVDRRVRLALAEHRAADERRLDVVMQRLTPAPRRPLGFVLHDGDEQWRPRGDGSGGGVFVWWVGPGED